MRLTINLEDDLHRMAKALAFSENISVNKAINRMLRKLVLRGEQPDRSFHPSPNLRIDIQTSLPVVKCRQRFTAEDVQRMEEKEDLRHWSSKSPSGS